MANNPSLKTLDDLRSNFEREIEKTPKDVLNSLFFPILKKDEIPFSRKIRSCDKIVKTNVYSLKFLSLSL